MWQKKPFLIIQVYNSLKPHHFRWSTPIMMVKLLWRLSSYFVSDSPHILTFTVLWLQVYRIQDTQYFSESNLQQDSCRGICSRTIFRQKVSQPHFMLQNHIFSDFQLLYLQKLHRIIAPFLIKDFFSSKRFFMFWKVFFPPKKVYFIQKIFFSSK